VFWAFEQPEISGKNLISITKGSKLSFFHKNCFPEMAFTGWKRTYINFGWGFAPEPNGESSPRPLAGGRGVNTSSPRTPPPPWPFGPRCRHPEIPPKIKPSYSLGQLGDFPWLGPVLRVLSVPWHCWLSDRMDTEYAKNCHLPSNILYGLQNEKPGSRGKWMIIGEVPHKQAYDTVLLCWFQVSLDLCCRWLGLWTVKIHVTQ